MNKKIGFIGGGNMAEGIIKGLLNTGAKSAQEILVKELIPARKQYLKETYGLLLTDSYEELAVEADILILAVRP